MTNIAKNKSALKAAVPADAEVIRLPSQRADDLQLLHNGYEPIACQGKQPVSDNWQSGAIDRERIVAMREVYPQAKSTGLRTGTLAAIDIDVRDADHAALIVELAASVFGDTPLQRFGAKGLLLCYRNETPIRKVTVLTDAEAKVEVLGSGQQFVAFGIHPDTGKPYEWRGQDAFDEIATPLTIRLDDLPAVTPAMIADFADQCAELMGQLGYGNPRVRKASDTERKAREADIDEDAPANVSRAKEHLKNCVEQGKVAVLGSLGNDTIYELACVLMDRFYLSHEMTETLMLDIWYPHCVPNTLEDEARSIITHAASYIQNEPGANATGSPSETFKGVAGPAEAENTAVVVPRVETFQFPDVNQYGMPKVTPENTRIALKAMGLDCRHDVFHDKLLVQGHHLAQWAGEVSDHACLMLRTIVRDAFRFEPTTKMMEDAVKQLCLKHNFDPVCDYLDGLQWDGTERLDRWMVDYLGAADTPLIRAFGRLSLIAAVRRARQPGAKFDQIIVLEGTEGKGKSTAIETLAGKENFSDQHILGVDDKTQQELLKGVWLYEIADLSGIRKADVDKVKAFASRREDRSRPAFGHFLLNQPRRCVIFATTNNEEYLQADENRRFWPVRVGDIDVERLKADRDQLWAEAAQREATGMSIMLPEALWPAARGEQALRREHDQWDDLLGDVHGTVVFTLNSGDGTGYEERISASDLLTHKLKLPADRINAATGKRLKAAMRRLGWEYHASLRIGLSKNGGYRRPCDAPAPASDGEPGDLLPPDF